ncbi:MAG: hypothetical protein J2P36_37535, partial [Ktedonobacteraceae bacterium]|nr:hypothetical protein [Ktedonobacteraceae bacterium]
AVVREYMAGAPVFYEAEEAHLRIVREAFSLVQSGDFYTAWCFVDFACRTGAYVIAGKSYSKPSFAVFEYTGRELAWKACPAILADHLAAVYDEGKWNVVNDTAHEVQGLLLVETRGRALDEALSHYAGAAFEYLNVERRRNLRRKDDIIQKLTAKSSEQGESYYTQALRFLAEHQIRL